MLILRYLLSYIIHQLRISFFFFFFFLYILYDLVVTCRTTRESWKTSQLLLVWASVITCTQFYATSQYFHTANLYVRALAIESYHSKIKFTGYGEMNGGQHGSSLQSNTCYWASFPCKAHFQIFFYWASFPFKTHFQIFFSFLFSHSEMVIILGNP